MDEQTSAQFEDLGANVTNESVIIVHLFKVADKVFINGEGAIAFPTFVLINDSLESPMQPVLGSF